jgi:hypothetical protein
MNSKMLQVEETGKVEQEWVAVAHSLSATVKHAAADVVACVSQLWSLIGDYCMKGDCHLLVT